MTDTPESIALTDAAVADAFGTATEQQRHALLANLDAWRESLVEELARVNAQFPGNKTKRQYVRYRLTSAIRHVNHLVKARNIAESAKNEPVERESLADLVAFAATLIPDDTEDGADFHAQLREHCRRFRGGVAFGDVEIVETDS